jgi:hypothetical protein
MAAQSIELKVNPEETVIMFNLAMVHHIRAHNKLTWRKVCEQYIQAWLAIPDRLKYIVYYVVPNHVHAIRREYITAYNVKAFAQVAREVFEPYGFKFLDYDNATRSRIDATRDGLHYAHQGEGGVVSMLATLFLNELCN